MITTTTIVDEWSQVKVRSSHVVLFVVVFDYDQELKSVKIFK